MKTQFTLKNGDVSKQGLACGHIQRFENNVIKNKDFHLDLWLDGGVYHVRAYELDGRGCLCFVSFDSLTKARKFFASQKKSLSN